MFESSKRTIEPIAYIRTDFKEKFGIPRQSGRVEELTGEIFFLPPYNVEGHCRE
jgi:tRNA (Thr-GGU) A37 N-methylase